MKNALRFLARLSPRLLLCMWWVANSSFLYWYFDLPFEVQGVLQPRVVLWATHVILTLLVVRCLRELGRSPWWALAALPPVLGQVVLPPLLLSRRRQ